MKARAFMIAAVFSLPILLIAGTGSASGAVAQSTCGTANLQVSPNTGADGAAVTATASNLMAALPSQLYWDAVGTSGQLGEATADAGGGFLLQFHVPASASPGAHQVILTSALPNEAPVQCAAVFTVEATTTQTTPTTALPADSGITITVPATTTAATPSKPAALPDTGVFLLVPAAGIALGGAGSFFLRRRGRK